MLLLLYIKNFILIEELHLKLTKGLCVLTGDSGSGKSLLLAAFDMIMGGRIDGSVAKNPNSPTVLTAEFDTKDQGLLNKIVQIEMLADLDIANAESLVIQRIIGQDNRSRFLINGAPSTAAQVRLLGSNLVEICSQRYQGIVLNSANHLEILDKYAKTQDRIKIITDLYEKLQISSQKLAEKQRMISAAADKVTYINETVNELNQANPQPNEEELLLEEKRNLNEIYQMREVVLKALEILDHGNNAATSGIKNAIRLLSKLPESKSSLTTTLESISIELADLVANLASIAGKHDDHKLAIEKIDDRIATLRHLARKYQCHSNELTKILEQNIANLTALELGEEQLLEYIEEAKNAELNYMSAAAELSLIRKKQAINFTKSVSAELQYLNMQHVEFQVVCEKLDDGTKTSRGIDRVEFLIRTNRNGQFAPLSRIASGGELSRIILALKVALGMINDVPLMIFDEVDVGIGGATASHVGHKLLDLANRGESAQVIVVTHQPQVAAYATQHWQVQKIIKDDQMFHSTFTELDYEGRVNEISRMLGGKSIATETILSAKKMINDASQNYS